MFAFAHVDDDDDATNAVDNNDEAVRSTFSSSTDCSDVAGTHTQHGTDKDECRHTHTWSKQCVLEAEPRLREKNDRSTYACTFLMLCRLVCERSLCWVGSCVFGVC